jgi:SAM-dependent methyltransferase
MVFVSMINTNVFASYITHGDFEDDQNKLQLVEYEKKLRSKSDLALPLEMELGMLKQLSGFKLGRFLLSNRGLNGYWTSYIILYGPKKKFLTPLEKWILHSSPVVNATRERFEVFNKILQKSLKNNITIASIPCGVMDDLLLLDTRSFTQIKFVGVDYDIDSIELARHKTLLRRDVNFDFYQKDAWKLDIDAEYDVITSNGLNIYESEDDKVVYLYKNFYRALKPGGLLITSFLTPPPTVSKDSTWRNYKKEDMIKQKAIFEDIIEARWQVFRTENQAVEQLKKAGFSEVEIIYDSQGMFPTMLAKKN